MVVVTVTVSYVYAQHREADTTTELAVTMERVAALNSRMREQDRQSALDRAALQQVVTATAVLGAAVTDQATSTGELRKLAYGIIGGIILQLLLTGTQLKRKT